VGLFGASYLPGWRERPAGLATEIAGFEPLHQDRSLFKSRLRRPRSECAPISKFFIPTWQLYPFFIPHGRAPVVGQAETISTDEPQPNRPHNTCSARRLPRTGQPYLFTPRTAGWTSTTTKARTRCGVCALGVATGCSAEASAAVTPPQFTSVCWPRASDTATTLGLTSATCSPACRRCFPRRAKNNSSPCCPIAGNRPEPASLPLAVVLRPPLLRVLPDTYPFPMIARKPGRLSAN
jgi:hypothetical protein